MKRLVEEFRIETNMEVEDEVLNDEIEPQNKALEILELPKKEDNKVEVDMEMEMEDAGVIVKEKEEKEVEVENEEVGVQVKEKEEAVEKEEARVQLNERKEKEEVVDDVELPCLKLEVVDELLELSKHRFTREKINNNSEGVEGIQESQFPTVTPSGTRKYTINKNKHAKSPRLQTKTPFTSPSFKRRKLMVEHASIS